MICRTIKGGKEGRKEEEASIVIITSSSCVCGKKEKGKGRNQGWEDGHEVMNVQFLIVVKGKT